MIFVVLSPQGSELVVHSSDLGLFPVLVEVVVKPIVNAATALLESVMQNRY